MWHEAVTEKYGYLSFFNQRGWFLIIPALLISLYVYSRRLETQKKYLFYSIVTTLFLIAGTYLS